MRYLDQDSFGMGRDGSGEGPRPRVMRAGSLLGKDVCNLQGEELGHIKEIVIDMRSGRIAYAVLSFGGVLGMAAKLFAVPWQALQLDTAARCFILDCSRRKLQNAHGFDKDRWPDTTSPVFASQGQDSRAARQVTPGMRGSP